MAIVKRIRTPISGNYPAGITPETGIFIGLVKDNRDIQRMGRLRIWVPEFGGDSRDPDNWILCSYASPFAGATSFKFIEKDIMEYNDTQTSYGFWAIPPDVDNQVLITFVNGDSTRGYWFACVYNNFMNQMVPGIAASEGKLHYGPETTTDECLLPTTEYNKYILEGRKNPLKPDDEKKPINTYFAQGLLTQGLIFDEIRGLTTSSARRESPSAVMGISTPGPVILAEDGGPEEHPYEQKHQVGRDDPDADPLLPVKRKGGHQFIMDDHPEHEHIKLRTRSGAEIILDETNGIVYITNKRGTAWIEMSDSGHIDIFGADSMSVRSEKDINFRADRDVNIEAGRNINMKAAKDYTDDPSDFLHKYADSEGKTVTDIFSTEDKKSYVNDFRELNKQVIKKELTLDQAFEKALEESGFEITSSARNLYSENQTIPAKTSLSSVEKLALIRGSYLVGEGFGEGGNVFIQGKQNINISSDGNTNVSASEGSIDIFASQDLKQTAGLSMNYFAGTSYNVTAGTDIDISSGSEMKITSGGNFHFTNLLETRFTLRGDVYILLEGENLKIQAQPVIFNDIGRELAPETTIHQTTIELQNFDLYAKKIKIAGDEGINFKSENGDVNIQSDTKFINISSQLGLQMESKASIQIRGVTSVNVQAAVLINSIKWTDTGAAAGAASALLASKNDFYSLFPEVSQWAERSSVADLADLASVPKIYSKHNVLPMLKLDGNKEYCLNYHFQIVETISRRFMTSEPCIEHENTGKVEEKDQDFSDNLEKFRILD